MLKYTDDPVWANLEPIPQNDGAPLDGPDGESTRVEPLACIAYTEEYSEAMSYLRAVMAANDLSERVLGLTEDIIRMNAAHYTVWLYRCKVLFALNKDLREEIQWVNAKALKHLKNYQIWHHRQTIIDKLDSSEGEVEFISKMLEGDAKNYHVWSYRQWLVKRFDLWNKGELEEMDKLLKQDVRNNSAWNHRWYLVFGKDAAAAVADETIIERELKYAKEAIDTAPQNQSPWNYIRGIVRIAKRPTSILQEFAEGYAPINQPDQVRSSPALDLLADIYAESEDRKENATQALDLLAQRFDPIRANYWNYRKGLVQDTSVAS